MTNPFSHQPNFPRSPQKKESLGSLWRLLKILMANLDFEDVVNKVVNSLLSELGYLKSGYRIVVLSLIDEQAGGLRRIALSETMEAIKAMEASIIPFEKIIIPFSATDNLGMRVLKEGKPLVTSYWPDILSPPLTPEAALRSQQASGIKTSIVYPVFAGSKPIGTLIFSMVKEYKEVSEEEKDLLAGFVDLVGLAVQNSKLYSSLQSTSSELKEANEKLKQLDKLKNDFVSVASHELRTPMTAIRSYAWMALYKSDVVLSEKLKKYLVRILISAERLINLVNNLLNVSRIEASKIAIVPESVDLISLTKDVLDEVYYSKSRDKEIDMRILEKPIPKVFADPEKLREVMLNLVGNAVKFTPSGGTVLVDFFSDGRVVEVSIKDNGAGIAPDDFSRLFHKFSRLDNSYTAMLSPGGTGLGLYISKNLIELMHGKIWVKSDGVDKGSTFTFSLPVASKEVLSQAEKYHIKPRGEAKGLEPVAF